MEDIKKPNLISQTRLGKNTTEFEPSDKVETELDSSNAFFINIFNACLDGILVGDPDGYVTMANKAAAQILGYPQDEIIGKHPLELGLTPQAEKESGKDVIENLLTKGLLSGLKRKWIRKDGTSIDIEMNLSLIKDKKGNIVGSVGSFRDITENKKVEGKLRESRNFSENIVESSLDAIVVTDEQGYVTNTNRAFCQLTGYGKADVLEKHMSQFAPIEPGNYHCTTGELIQIDKQFGDNIGSKMTGFSERGKLKNKVGFYLRKDKKIVPVESNIVFLFGNNGEKLGAFAVIRDITVRRKAEIEVTKTKDYLENIFRTSVDGIIITNPKGRITSVNKAAEKIFDCSSDQLVGKHLNEMRLERERQQTDGTELLYKLIEKGNISGVERTWKKSDGSAVDVEMNIALLKDDEENVMGSVSSVRDITDRKKAEKALKESEEKYYNLIEHANDAIVSVNSAGVIIGFNKKAEEMFGYSREEVIGKTSYLLISQQTQKNYKEALKQFAKTGTGIDRANNILEGRGVRKEGEEFPVEYSYYTINIKEEFIITAIVRDISERKVAEKKFKQYQKKLKALTSQMTLTEERERRRFAEYLHDEIGQYLFATNMQLGQLKKSIRSAKEAAILDKAITNIKEMVNKSRSLTFELSPPILYEFGLEKTLEWLADQVYKQYNLFVAIEDDRQKKPLNADMKIFLYQAVRELLNNVTKHSRKEKAIVSIKKDNSHITVCVEDNGVGFDISGLDSFDTMKGKFGLFHIKERMEQLGGQFVIASQPNRGTHVTLIAPLQNTP